MIKTIIERSIMSNFLFITSEYTGLVGASGICTRSLAEELKSRGHNVWVLAYENGIDEENVYTIPVRRPNNNPLLKVLKTIQSLCFPIIDKNSESEFIKKSIYICKKHNIDVLVCVYFPLETISVLKPIKEVLPNVSIIVYELDSVGDGIFSTSKFNFLAKRNYELSLARNYGYADSIIIMRSHKEYWVNTWGKNYGSKLMVADIPVLFNKTKAHDNRTIGIPTFIYCGMLSSKYRSPKALLEIFDELTKQNNVSLDFYSKGDCEPLISAFAENNPCIRRFGYVESDVLEGAVQNADFLVSIGNKSSNSVPSKLISYFSYGKPVIHISANKGDVCEYYINSYPLGIVLYEYDSIRYNANKINDFINMTLGKFVPFSDISRCLYMNTPQHSANLIENTSTSF